MKKIYFSFFIFFFAVSFTYAQKQIGVNLNYFKGTEAFSNYVDKNPVGLSFSYLLQSKANSRLQYGIEAGVAMYSNDKYQYELVAEGHAGEFIQVDEEDCFLKYHVLGRYKLFENENFYPYVEGRIGFTSFFSSRTALERTDLYRDEFKFHGTAFNSGFGGGLVLDLANIFSKHDQNSRVRLDLGFTYNSGSKTEYRNMEDVSAPVSGLDQGKYSSLTNFFNYKVGLLLNLGDF